VRYIEGELTAGESEALRAVLDEPLELLTEDERAEWLGRLDRVALVSDAFFPFRDNIDYAARRGVRYIAQPGGSARDTEVEEACREHGISMVHTGVRLFHH
jgi:phosphoribosylaminoimidazolecarboxamide formyltransferase/IMP cyclohydrolase